jgi:hypothetical protein
MEKSFDSETDVFPFTVDEWACMMLSMYANQENYPEFKDPFDIKEISP